MNRLYFQINLEKAIALKQKDDERRAHEAEKEARHRKRLQSLLDASGVGDLSLAALHDNARPDKPAQVRLEPKVVQEIVCCTLEEVAAGQSDLPADAQGYISGIYLGDAITEYIQRMVPAALIPYYQDVRYDISEIVGLVNRKLELVGRQIEVRRSTTPFSFKGYAGLHDDLIQGYLFGNKNSIDKDVYQFIKGPLDFNTMTVIRNYLRFRRTTLENELATNPAYAGYSRKKQDEFLADHMPTEPFICIEDSIHEFTPDYARMTAVERDKLVKLAVAIITQKVIKVSYKPFHLTKADDLEFHPHYIRKVGGKLLCYGYSRSIRWHRPKEYRLVNLVVSRIVSIGTLTGTVRYQGAAANELDYNNSLFRDRMTFNAPGYNDDTDECVEVILKVRKTVQTPTFTRYPYERLLKEPLHHSQKVCTTYPEDAEWGYVSLQVKDCMAIPPILLGMGSDLQVVAPGTLRELMKRRILEMAGLYDDDK